MATLRQYYPNVTIDILLSEYNQSALCATSKFTNNQYIYSKSIFSINKLIIILRKRKYDLVIDMLDNPSTTNAFIIKFIKPLYSLGFKKKKSNKYNLEVPIPNKLKNHIVDRINQLILPFGIDPDSIPKKLIYNINPKNIEKAHKLLPPKSKQYRLGINLAGSNMSKFWGVENNKEFINYIITFHHNFEIIIFSNNLTKDLIKEIDIQNNCLQAPTTSDFDIFAAMIKTCDIILSPDTSVVHLAASFHIPIIALFLFSGQKEMGMAWTAYNSPSKCIKTGTDIMTNISPLSVINSFEELIAENKLNG